MEHYPDCIELTAKTKAEIEAYEKQWPNHCRKCGGWGGHSAREFMGMYGMAPAFEDQWDYCPDCIEQDKCPRCGGKIDFIDDLNCDSYCCPSCRWTDDDPQGKPEEWPCDCEQIRHYENPDEEE